MSEHLALRSSVGSRSSALLPYHHRGLPPPPPPPAAAAQHPDPLNSVWIRRLHLIPNHPPPPPPPPPRPPPPPLPQAPHHHHHQDAASTDESRTPPPAIPLRTPGFGPFRWSPRPLRGAPIGAWDAVNAAAVASPSRSGGGGGPPMLSPFFRRPAPSPSPPVTDVGEFSPTMPLIEVGSSSGSGSGSGGFSGLSSRMIADGSTHATPFAMAVAGAAYPSHAVDMVPIRTLHDIHDRQPSVIPRNFSMRSPSSGSQQDGFSHWNMGRFRRNTTTSSISPIGVAPGNFGKKRNADSNNFLPLKFRKMSGAI